jgi:Fic family protein
MVRIHAFDDGNGRGARIFMNLILLKNGFFPVVVRNEKKRTYLEALWGLVEEPPKVFVLS